ncbi:Protein kinase superfamily protein [Raphanus sativus]|uniref:Serine/threonine-protein kinase ppk15-like isoform X1 n=2 Tax=Raphanus sativus TaxID=3726 RepID=A0A6J0N066_RAPSA|nr:serine/threonine-protein kinase ppk15-like isoform X1 [Raphanus sativus]KAJ4903950.1 Protein kinase superfamily protein [Raphanus sativus]
MEMDVESVLQFLRRNGLTEAESALRDDINEQNQLISFDFEKFLFPIPPPIRITASPLPHPPDSSKSSSDEEFVSLDSFTSGFVNPYGDGSSSSSSESMSQFGTARTYQEWSEFYLQTKEETEEDEFMSPSFTESDFFIFPAHTQDKFITDNQFENNNLGVYDKSSQGSQTEASLDYLDKTFLINNLEDDSKEYFGLERECFDGELLGFSCEEDAKVNVTDEEVDVVQDLVEDEYEVFDLRIIHWKNRTGFEANKDLPIVLNSVIGGRYYITEYIGSAAFSKVVQAQDLHNGVDVCLKIIKNDKDFFDQSLDEIKLLKHVNKHDPADEHHILRLYDYFYHQEHLFIVCELLRANLYEFQKFNQESGGEPYFNLSRLQVIMRQCLEALVFLHGLGIIHCDLKPENILIKSYKKCAVKIIDLGSSCFRSDNLCLYVQSRSYRAPEVILGLPYDEKIDLWSLGCILAELCSGEVLFPNEAVAMILARIVAVLGPIETEMLEKGQETHKYFTKEFELYHLNEESNEIEYIITEESCLEDQLHVSDELFLDFVRSLLEINPLRRPTALEALDHPWLSSSSYN